jgi:hypothetical protein
MNLNRNNLSYQDVLDNLAKKGISIRVASPKLVMEEAPESYKGIFSFLFYFYYLINLSAIGGVFAYLFSFIVFIMYVTNNEVFFPAKFVWHFVTLFGSEKKLIRCYL